MAEILSSIGVPDVRGEDSLKFGNVVSAAAFLGADWCWRRLASRVSTLAACGQVVTDIPLMQELAAHVFALRDAVSQDVLLRPGQNPEDVQRLYVLFHG